LATAFGWLRTRFIRLRGVKARGIAALSLRVGVARRIRVALRLRVALRPRVAQRLRALVPTQVLAAPLWRLQTSVVNDVSSTSSIQTAA
jgi:hypothetical protein